MRYRNALIGALVVFASAGLSLWAQSGSGVSAVYKTANVSKSGDHVSMSFTVRLMNVTDADLKFSTVKLADPANINTFARWDNVTVPANKSVDLSDSVSVTSAEYGRWKKGGGANLWVVAPDPESTTRATAVSATYKPTGW
jgi:hypothetical protein